MSATGAFPAAAEPARGPRLGEGPVGILDVGSNSVRLVLYEHASRAPTVFFNEKVLAALGEEVGVSGRLSEEAMARALAAIERFVALADLAEARSLTIVATAASRDASNGAAFIERIEAVTGRTVRVLAGREEAEMAAYGVMCGAWRPDGVVGDLGGGSLELIDVGEDGLGPGDSFPLGTLRLRADSKDSLSAAAKLVAGRLDSSQQLPLLTGRAFYAVGGTWRSLVRLHMAQRDYPISVMHHYTIPGDEMAAFCDVVLEDGVEAMKGGETVSKNRRPLVPWGAVVLREILRRGKPEAVIASALGVREGLIYSELDPDEQRRDPLLIAAGELARLRSRSPQNAAEVVAWTGEVFAALGVRESDDERRLRAAASLLSDIGWRAHPDYRGDQALAIISNVALYGVDHPGRGYLALALYERYGGLAEGSERPAAEALCPPRLQNRAEILAACFRLAYVLAPGVPGVLPRTRLVRRGSDVVLLLPRDLAALDGERPRRRLRQLAKLVNAESDVQIADRVEETAF